MTTRMSDDRDDHISRSKTNDPTRDTRESRGKARARTMTNDSTLVITLFFILLFMFYIFSDETVVNNRIDFCFYVSR